MRLVVATANLFAIHTAGAQICLDPGAIRGSVISAGSFADDRRRIAQDLGRCSTSGELIRSARSLSTPLPPATSIDTNRIIDLRAAFAPPSIDVTHNSALPFSLNDGPQWAGRGFTTTISAGVRVETDHASLSVSPQVVYQQNTLFQVLKSGVYFPAPDRSQFASPFHSGLFSVDLPSRFGDRSQAIFYPGESWLDVMTGPVAFGFSTDNQWWGPGIRNALVMSNNAPGIPQLYFRSREPLTTPIGDVEFRWLLGGLTESLYFDTVSTNNMRSLSAAIVTFRPFSRGLTLGVSRAVYAPAGGVGDLPSHIADAFMRWHQSSDTLVDTIATASRHDSDQLLSVFGRWVFPTVGFEAYAEWAKLFPPGLRELLVEPQSHQGYTVGLQWVNRLSSVTAFRLQAEATMLEQTPPTLRATIPSFYTSRFVPQGYTQRGQVIGAAIGPGSSSQFLAGDYLAAHWRGGLELGRIRWDDDAYYRTPNGQGFLAHDVSIFAGLRGGTAFRGFDIDVEAIAAKRMNYLFQSPVGGYAESSAFDVGNYTIRMRVSPR